MLGVKLTTLSLSVSFSGVCGAGTELPRGLMGVMRVLIFSLPRRLRDLAVRLAGVGVDASVAKVVVGEGLGDSTILIVLPKVL